MTHKDHLSQLRKKTFHLKMSVSCIHGSEYFEQRPQNIAFTSLSTWVIPT